MRYSAKSIVITGASDGIGAEIARQLAVQGPRLVLAARSADKLESVAASCRSLGADVEVVAADVSLDDDCRRIAQTAIDRFGGIDVLVANAGVSMHARFDEITDFATFERLWRVNCLGTVQAVRHCWDALKASRGQIVGISSLAGKTGVPARSTYCASKFAQSGFLDALRIEAEDFGITVSVVYPGVVATDIRRNGLDGRGERAGTSGLDEAGAMAVAECARQIIDAMTARRREWVMTPRARFGLWLKLIAPRLVDNMARAALARSSPAPSNRTSR